MRIHTMPQNEWDSVYVTHNGALRICRGNRPKRTVVRSCYMKYLEQANS